MQIKNDHHHHCQNCIGRFSAQQAVHTAQSIQLAFEILELSGQPMPCHHLKERGGEDAGDEVRLPL